MSKLFIFIYLIKFTKKIIWIKIIIKYDDHIFITIYLLKCIANVFIFIYNIIPFTYNFVYKYKRSLIWTYVFATLTHVFWEIFVAMLMFVYTCCSVNEYYIKDKTFYEQIVSIIFFLFLWCMTIIVIKHY